MLTIVWNPSGFHLVNILPKRLKFNASYYVTQILDPLSKRRRTQVGPPIENWSCIPITPVLTRQKWHCMLWSRIRCREHYIQHTDTIWHPLISSSLARFSNSCQDVNSQTRKNKMNKRTNQWTGNGSNGWSPTFVCGDRSFDGTKHVQFTKIYSSPKLMFIFLRPEFQCRLQCLLTYIPTTMNKMK
jgi:hypothetical protein